MYIMSAETIKSELVIGKKVTIDNLIISESILSRMVGLLGRSGLKQGSAMLLKPCGSIHTVGMKFSLDLIFLDKDNCIVRTVCGVAPNRFVLGGFGAKSVVEVESGWLDVCGLRTGDKCLIRKI
jgi:uncharacterized membrane protein (UPF0127 family)